jgi:hypothetical protein
MLPLVYFLVEQFLEQGRRDLAEVHQEREAVFEKCGQYLPKKPSGLLRKASGGSEEWCPRSRWQAAGRPAKFRVY